jgi:hypothetical protein
VVPIDYVGTDPARALAATDDFVAAANDPRSAPLALRLHSDAPLDLEKVGLFVGDPSTALGGGD